MEEAEKILTECRQLLAGHRQQLEGILLDPRISQWRTISIEVHGELLETLGVPAETAKAASRLQGKLGPIFDHLDACRNELANQETDLRFSPAPPAQLMAAAAHLAGECDRLRQPLEEILKECAALCQAEKTLRQRLRLENLFNLAQKRSGAKGDAFDTGCRVFSLVTGIGTAQGKEKSFQEQFAEAGEVKSRLQHLDLQDLPCMAAEIIQQQVGLAVDALEQVKNILEQGEQSLSLDIDAVRRLAARLSDLAKAPLPDIMQELDRIAADLGDCIVSFASKQHVARKLQAVTAILENLKLFNRALKSDVLGKLREEITKPGSSLNPATLAGRNSEKYFSGFKGFWRLIKLFCQSTGGGRGLDALSLHLLLEKAIGDCTAYRGAQEVDPDSLRAFLAARLREYRKPFPHDELLRLLRATLDAYAVRVEKSLYGHRLDDETLKELSAGAGFLNAGSLTIGKLLRSVQRQTNSLERGLS
ncbi:MAG: hypothetical protein M0017_11555 [Desulfobacteraceae bacterium]|nr:hypothetical protein [Desulfobacteraceae bacterium]